MISRIFLTFFLLVQTSWVIGAEGAGMPQLNPESFSSQIFWLFVFFSLLLFSMHFFFLPKIKNIRFKRNETIDTYLNETKELNQKIEDLIKKMDEEFSSNKILFEKEIKKALEENKLNFDQKINSFDKELEKKKLDFGNDLMKAKQQIDKNIPKICMELSDQLYEKILGEKIRSNAKEFDEAIKDL